MIESIPTPLAQAVAQEATLATTFDEFYTQQYRARHADKLCRAFHLAGFLASALFLGVVVWLENWWLLPFVPLPTFLLGWVGHRSVGNQPTFLEHPLWSIRAFGKMFGGILFTPWALIRSTWGPVSAPAHAPPLAAAPDR
jgi:hypothetical protein